MTHAERKAAVLRGEKLLGRKLTALERLESAAIVDEPGELRAVVHENPDARNPLTRDLFNGPFDERYGMDGSCVRRVFVGSGIQRLEGEIEMVQGI
jgi:hypothetical protein